MPDFDAFNLIHNINYNIAKFQLTNKSFSSYSEINLTATTPCIDIQIEYKAVRE